MCSYTVKRYKYLKNVKYVQRSDCCYVYKDGSLNAIVYDVRPLVYKDSDLAVKHVQNSLTSRVVYIH